VDADDRRRADLLSLLQFCFSLRGLDAAVFARGSSRPRAEINVTVRLLDGATVTVRLLDGAAVVVTVRLLAPAGLETVCLTTTRVPDRLPLFEYVGTTLDTCVTVPALLDVLDGLFADWVAVTPLDLAAEDLPDAIDLAAEDLLDAIDLATFISQSRSCLPALVAGFDAAELELEDVDGLGVVGTEMTSV
jgi:hypothetical protein